MRYLVMIFGPENDSFDFQDPEVIKEFQEYQALNADMKEAGVLIEGDSLQPTRAATSIRVRDNETLTTDGPFAETKEALGGYYLLECTDLDEAIKWAERIPGARHGVVEVRPVVDFSQG